MGIVEFFAWFIMGAMVCVVGIAAVFVMFSIAAATVHYIVRWVWPDMWPKILRKLRGKKEKKQQEETGSPFFSSGKWHCPVCRGDMHRIKIKTTRQYLTSYTLVCETCGNTFKRSERK